MLSNPYFKTTSTTVTKKAIKSDFKIKIKDRFGKKKIVIKKVEIKKAKLPT